MATTSVDDYSWVKSSFLLPSNAILNDAGSLRRIYSTNMQSAFDTTPGGCYVLNPLPQFTRYADIKHNNVFGGNRGKSLKIDGSSMPKSNATFDRMSNGMGRTYHEKFFRNWQRVHFRMGVAEFNDLYSYFTNYYSVSAATMARTGRTAGALYTLGWALGSVASMPLQPFLVAGRAWKFLMRKPASKYYYLKPTMYPYWAAVSSMVNGIAANMGIIPRPIANSSAMLYEKDEIIDQKDVDAYHKMIPSIYRAKGGIDVFAIAQRAQKLVNERRELLDGELDGIGDYKQMQAVMQKRLYGDDLPSVYNSYNVNDTNLEAYAELWRSSMGLGSTGEGDASLKTDTFEKTQRGDGWWQKFGDAWTSERKMGSEFVTFRVDYTGTQTESFSSSTKESSISSQINSISASARESRFSMADGNIDNAGIIKAGMDGLKSFLSGAAEGFGVQGLAQLAGSAFADIPKMWDSSSCDFNKTTLNIALRSPYGDPMSRLQNIILPLCALFAMAVPLSTGKQSFTSPFLVECFNQGRTHIRLGLVDSFSVTRGVGDVGWTNQGHFLGADVSMSIVDLSSVVHMPLQAGFTLTDAIVKSAGYAIGSVTSSGEEGAAIASAMLGSVYDDDNAYTDYLAILSGMPLEAELNTKRKWAVRLAREQAKFDDMKSPNRMAMWAQSGIVGDVIKALSLSTDRF